MRGSKVVGKHYNWHKKWSVDAAKQTATHDTGLIVYFGNPPDGSEPFGGGAVLPDNLLTVRAALESKNGKHNTPQMLQRLSREAADTWNWVNREK